jgi:hypothetical protein
VETSAAQTLRLLILSPNASRCSQPSRRFMIWAPLTVASRQRGTSGPAAGTIHPSPAPSARHPRCGTPPRPPSRPAPTLLRVPTASVVCTEYSHVSG